MSKALHAGDPWVDSHLHCRSQLIHCFDSKTYHRPAIPEGVLCVGELQITVYLAALCCRCTVCCLSFFITFVESICYTTYLHIPYSKRLAKFPMAKILEMNENAILLAVFTYLKESTILQITNALFLGPNLS